MNIKTSKVDDSYIKFLRNVGIIAHIDSGKTTVTERMSYLCKNTHKIGEVHDGNTLTDYMDLERERGITIQSATVTLKWISSNQSSLHCKINLIDTPGHVDFGGEVERSLRVLDGAVLVMDGKEGVEAQTETVWLQANRYKIPRIVFVNKMDGVENEARFDRCLDSLIEVFFAKVLTMQLPIGAGRDFKGIVDIIEGKAYYFTPKDKDEKQEVREIPAYLLDRSKKLRLELIETTIHQDELLAEKYLNGEEITNDELRSLVRKATLTGSYFPVFCGSAFQNIGIKLLLDAILNYLPSPNDSPLISLHRDDKYKNTIEPNSLEELDDSNEISYNSTKVKYLALAFKIVVDENNNTITYIRVYVGKIQENSSIRNVNKDKNERAATLVIMNGDVETKVSVVRAGEIAAIKNLKYTSAGDTLSDLNLLLEPITFDEPVISQAIIPQTKADVERLGISLEKLNMQDPSFKFLIDSETGQVIIKGMGELHLDILVETLRRKYKLNLATEPPRISYRETITKVYEGWGEYKKQSGGHGHYARIFLRFEPNVNKGFEFVNKIRGEAVSKKYAEFVSKGLVEVMASGLLLGYPMIDMKVTLLDGDSHKVDSSNEDFKEAAVLTCRKNKEHLGLTLLEPIMDLFVFTPRDYAGDILADLAAHRMVIENVDEDGGLMKVSGKVPLKEILSYSTTLRQITKGRGKYTTKLFNYQEVPKDILEKILKQ